MQRSRILPWSDGHARSGRVARGELKVQPTILHIVIQRGPKPAKKLNGPATTQKLGFRSGLGCCRRLPCRVRYIVIAYLRCNPQD